MDLNVKLKKKNNYFGVYESYNNLFGTVLTEKEIISSIQRIPLIKFINVLSQLNLVQANDFESNKTFMSFIKEKVKKTSNIKSDVIFSEQGLLAVWKWIFCYGDMNYTNDKYSIEQFINTSIFLNLAISDYLNDEKIDHDNIKYEIFSNAAFNLKPEIGSILARSVIIFDEISKQNEVFHPNDYIDIHTPFEQKYGYSIKEYLSVIFAIFSGFQKKENADINFNWSRPLNYFQDSPLRSIAELILKELSISFQDAKDWSLLNINRPWDYTKFRQKPILQLENESYLPINLNFLYEKVFSELYFKIREAFPKDNTQVISFYGKCFEKYVEMIAKNSFEKSKKPYKYIEEFQYGRSAKRSPDAMIRLGDSMLVLEAKIYRLKMDSLIGGISSIESIEKDIEKIAVLPIKQLHDRVVDLMEGNHDTFNGVKRLYLCSITFGGFPTIEPFEKRINLQLKEYFKIPVKYHFHMDIEEFELLMEIITREEAKTVFRYLDNKNKHEHTKYLPMKNYLIKEGFEPGRSQLIQNKLNHFMQDIVNIVAP